MAPSFRSIAIGLAGLAAGIAVDGAAAPAQAQGFHPGYGYRGYGFRGYGYRGWGGPAYGYRPAYRWGYGPGYGPAYGYGYGPRPYWRGYRPAYYGYGYGYPYGAYAPYDGGAVVAGLIGGLALGAIANAPRTYRPVAYQPRCWYQPRRVVNRYGALVVRQVRTCG